jgi:hypothetical protein
MRRLHFVIGASALVAFLATGLYMRLRFPPMVSLDKATRLLYRSTHIYLLFAALLNLVIGVCPEPTLQGWRLAIRRAGSVLIMVGPIFCLVAFLREPSLSALSRPYTLPAFASSLVGVLCHVASNSVPMLNR